jgi:serine/threonine protein kinase
VVYGEAVAALPAQQDGESMTPERWQQIKSILEDALETPLQERSAFLDQACSDDAEMRKELDSLLKSNEEVRSGFLYSTFPPVTLIRGSRIGEYEVRTLVGSGGMGEVYRARDTRLDRDVAIKVLPAYLSSDPRSSATIRTGSASHCGFEPSQHPFRFSICSFEGAPYLVTELLDGETLGELIRRGHIAQRKAIDLAAQIAQGLAAAHGKGIVHRDLKPENIFMTKDGRIKILDFGLAKLIGLEPRHNALTSADTEPGMIMGTASYMAPEQVRGQAADNRSDIFAFGTIMYEMLSGKRAFHRETSADTMSAILKEDPAPLPEPLSPALSRIVRRCLEKNPGATLSVGLRPGIFPRSNHDHERYKHCSVRGEAKSDVAYRRRRSAGCCGSARGGSLARKIAAIKP